MHVVYVVTRYSLISLQLKLLLNIALDFICSKTRGYVLRIENKVFAAALSPCLCITFLEAYGEVVVKLHLFLINFSTT
jgi:hypothetical protein